MFAECNDGTFSGNRDFSKTCASGKGVKRWVAPNVLCRDGTVVALNKNTTCGNDGVDRPLSAAEAPRVLDRKPSVDDLDHNHHHPSRDDDTHRATTSTVVAPAAVPAPSCAATVSNARPTRNTTITVAVTSNQPNAPVHASVNYRTTTTTVSAMTDSSGAATIPISIGAATIGYTVEVAVTAGTARCKTSFTPV